MNWQSADQTVYIILISVFNCTFERLPDSEERKLCIGARFQANSYLWVTFSGH